MTPCMPIKLLYVIPHFSMPLWWFGATSRTKIRETRLYMAHHKSLGVML